MDDNIVQANEILQQQNSDQLFKNLLGYAVSLSSKGQNIVNNYIGSAKNYKFFSLSWLDVTVSVIFLTLTAGYWSIHMPDVDSAIVLDNSFSYFDSEYVRMLCFFSQIIDLNREMQSNYSYTLSQEEEMLTSKNKTPNILRNNSNSRYNTSPYLYYVLMFFFLLPFILSIHLTSFFNSWTDSFSYISVKFKELSKNYMKELISIETKQLKLCELEASSEAEQKNSGGSSVSSQSPFNLITPEIDDTTHQNKEDEKKEKLEKEISTEKLKMTNKFKDFKNKIKYIAKNSRKKNLEIITSIGIIILSCFITYNFLYSIYFKNNGNIGLFKIPKDIICQFNTHLLYIRDLRNPQQTPVNGDQDSSNYLKPGQSRELLRIEQHDSNSHFGFNYTDSEQKFAQPAVFSKSPTLIILIWTAALGNALLVFVHLAKIISNGLQTCNNTFSSPYNNILEIFTKDSVYFSPIDLKNDDNTSNPIETTKVQIQKAYVDALTRLNEELE